MARIRGIGEGRRAFLIGNGPSVNTMPLELLANDFVCVVNMGIRSVGEQLPHADMHVVTDTNRYRRFAGEIETAALEHPVPYRFVARRVRRIWKNLPERANRPYFIVPHTAKLADLGDLPPVSEGVVRAATVLVTGAVLLEFLGFSPIYVIGCDIDYKTHGTYFYEMNELDIAHEHDPAVVKRRAETVKFNDNFACLRAAFARRGRELINAGVGGNLTSLDRTDFSGLFADRQAGASL